MKKFKIQLMKNVYITEEIEAACEETAIRVVEDMIEQGIDEDHLEEDQWQIDSIFDLGES